MLLRCIFLHVVLHQDLTYENNFNKDNNLALLKEYWLFNTKKSCIRNRNAKAKHIFKMYKLFWSQVKGSLTRQSWRQGRWFTRSFQWKAKQVDCRAVTCEGPSDRKLFFQHVRQLGISLGQHGQQLLKLQRGGGGDAQHKHTNYCLT